MNDNRGKFSLNRVFGAIALLILIVGVQGCVAKTNPIDTPNSIAVLEEVELGGFPQSILIRGNDINNPVLLHVHGGPGSPAMPGNHKNGAWLEKDFVLVHWDQRGAGKSYRMRIPESSMNVDRFIEDCHELTLYLKQRFNREKIYIWGQSWGSLLGTLTVDRYPGDYIAYIGSGQVVELQRNEAISYRFVIDQARKRKDRIGIMNLTMIGDPPYRNILKTAVQRSYLNKYGGAVYQSQKSSLPVSIFTSAPEYTALDSLRETRGMLYTINQMWDEVMTYDLIRQVPRIEIPVYFLQGRHDYNTPWELVQEYYDVLDAPAGKKIVWFENSAHGPHREEPERFAEVMREIVLAETISR